MAVIFDYILGKLRLADAPGPAGPAGPAGQDATLSDASPAALAATAAPGTSDDAARADHVHPTTGLVLGTEKGTSNGVATLDGNGKVPLSQLPGSVGGDPIIAPYEHVVEELIETTYPAYGQIDLWVEFKNLRIIGMPDTTKWRPYDIPALEDGEDTLPEVKKVWLPGRLPNADVTDWADGEGAVALVRLEEDDALDLAFQMCRSRMPKTFPALEGTGEPIPDKYVDAPAYLWRLLEIDVVNNYFYDFSRIPSQRRLRTLYEESEYFVGNEDYLTLARQYTDRWVLVRPYVIRDDFEGDENWPAADTGPLPRYAYGPPGNNATSGSVRGFMPPVFDDPRYGQPLDPSEVTWWGQPREDAFGRYATAEISGNNMTTKIATQQAAWTDPSDLDDYTPEVECWICAKYEADRHPWVKYYRSLLGECMEGWAENLGAALAALAAFLGRVYEHRMLTNLTGGVTVPVPENAAGIDVSYLTPNATDHATAPSVIDPETGQASLKYTTVMHASTIGEDADYQALSFVDEAGNAVDLDQAAFCHIALAGIPGNVKWLVYRWYNASGVAGLPGYIKIGTGRVIGHAPAPPVAIETGEETGE